MYSRQLITSQKNPPCTATGLFTSQAMKTGTNFLSHKKLGKDTQDGSPSLSEPINFENVKFLNYKPFNFHSKKLSESPDDPKIKKKASDFCTQKSNQEPLPSQNEFSSKKNTENEIHKIPCFEARLKGVADHKADDMNSTQNLLRNPMNEGKPPSYGLPVKKERSNIEELFVRNHDTGEIFLIDDAKEIEKFQDIAKSAEYLEKLKKRKKEEIWQDWWTEKKKINSELFSAVKSNNIALVSKLFEENRDDKKPEINARDEKDWTCLHFACLAGNYDMVLFIIKNEAEIDPQTNLKQTPLIISAQKGYEKVVSLLLTSGSDINHQDLSKNTALHYSSIYGYKEVVKILLANPCINMKLANLENKTASEATSFQEIRKWIDALKFKLPESQPPLAKNISLKTLRGHFSESSETKHYSPEIRKKGSNNTRMNERGEKYEDLIKPLFKINDRTLSNVTGNSVLQSNSTSVSEHDSAFFLYNDQLLEREKIGIQSFELLSLIGKGSFGEVYLVEKKSNHELYALKVLSKDKILSNNLVKYAVTERNVLSFCSHPFIVHLHAAFQTQEHLFLLQTFCPGGNLAEYIRKEKRFPEPKACLYAAEVLLALDHLHKKDIIYRDLKPDNIVLDKEGHALLTDFGLSREGVYDQMVAKSFCGSVAYLAPEMLKRQGHGKAVDWYLLGVLLYEMLVGVPPFYSVEKALIFENIEKGSLNFPASLSKEAKQLIGMLLERDPNKRLGSGPAEAREIMEQPFFGDIVWDDVLSRKKSPGTPYLTKKYIEKGRKVDLEDAFQDSTKGFSGENIPGWSFLEK